MRQFWLVLAILFGLTAAAAAQGCGPQNPNCIVPTAPAGTNNNQAASTAFVKTAVSTPTPPLILTTTGTIEALTVTQTGPSSSTLLNSNIFYSDFEITSRANAGVGFVSSGLRLNMAVGGPNATGHVWGIWVDATYNVASVQNGDIIAITPRCVASAANTGTGGCYGANPQAVLLSGASMNATNGEVTGMECDSRIDSGASAAWHFGCAAVNTGTVHGSLLDAAYEAGSAVAGGSWINALLLNSGHGQPALATTGCVVCTDGVGATIATGIDLSPYTISGYFLRGPGTKFAVDGNGNITGATGAFGLVGGTSGPFVLNGTATGAATFLVQAAQGTPSLTVPNTSGTLAASGTSPIAVNSTTGAVTCTTCITTAGGQTISALLTLSGTASPMLLVQSTGANNAYITINNVAGGNQSGFSLLDASALKWQFIKQTDNTFLIFDGANSVVMATFTPGAASAGFVTFGNTTASTSSTTGGLKTSGGLGVAGAGYFGAEVAAGTGHFIATTAAKTLQLKQGANGAVGTFICTSGGSITVTNSNVAISDAIIISLNTAGGTITTAPALNAITAATSFVAKCATNDTATYNYAIIKNAA